MPAGHSPSKIIRWGFILLAAGVAVLIPIVPRADSGWALAVPLMIAGAGLGLLVSQLNNYTLAPIEEEHVSEAAGVNSAGGSFGLSFGLAFAGAVMLGSLSLIFTQQAESSTVLTPVQQEQVAKGLQQNAEVMTNTELEHLLAGQPPAVQDEIIKINTEARPIALQLALGVPLIAALLGVFLGFRMTRLPDPEALGCRRESRRRISRPGSCAFGVNAPAAHRRLRHRGYHRGMHIFRRIHLRIALLVLVGLVAVGVGAAFAATRRATAQIGTGVVVINTNLAYQGAAAAGTGMVLPSNGEILTNNHVIKGATTITVRIPGTTPLVHRDGRRLRRRRRRRRAATGERLQSQDGDDRRLGEARGRPDSAGGRERRRHRHASSRQRGGSPASRRRSPSATTTAAPERLSGLIETNAALQPGDSGGPLLNSAGTRHRHGHRRVARAAPSRATRTTATPSRSPRRSRSSSRSSRATRPPACTSAARRSSASRCEDGPSRRHDRRGRLEGPAAQAGLATGDVITAIGAPTSTSAAAIQKAILARAPGAKVSVTYLDDVGNAHGDRHARKRPGAVGAPGRSLQ